MITLDNVHPGASNFHDDWAKNNVTFRVVFTCFHYIHIEKNAPSTGSHVFSPIWTIFELVRDINKTNVLTNFHDDWAKILTSRVLTSHVIQLTGTIFELNSHIKETNKNAPPTGSHVFSPLWTILELIRDINKTNVLTNFHDDWEKKLTSRVLTRKTAPPPPGSHVIQLTGTIFELNSHIKKTNVLTKFHENWAKNVTSRTIFELVRDINKTNVLTNFHDDWAKIVTSRVFSRKTAPPPGSHVIELTRTISELYSHIKETNVLTKFHENWAKNVTPRRKMPHPLAAMSFSPIRTIVELVVRDINKTNVLTNFHDDWAKMVTSRVFTRFLYSQIGKTATIYIVYINIEKNAPPTGGHISIKSMKPAPPTGGHVFQQTGTIFQLNQDIIKTNILTKLHED
ncbi:hypothetical protein DPMN_117753 [Dreissena polymorpha]|uniref:Uncharacterized protein n=1 Tax=Dreissena polymorpha TaxID=45954 RepID=A0A9D4GJL1_DREPO|nr:hypothetical protein DPMN_117753 [Dreissena polymorpha]